MNTQSKTPPVSIDKEVLEITPGEMLKRELSQKAALAAYDVKAIGFTPYRTGWNDGWNERSKTVEELYKALENVTEKLRLSLQYWTVTKDGDNFLQSEYEDNMSCYGAIHNASKILELSKL